MVRHWEEDKRSREIPSVRGKFPCQRPQNVMVAGQLVAVQSVADRYVADQLAAAQSVAVHWVA